MIEQRKPITARNVEATKMGLRYFHRVLEMVSRGVFFSMAWERDSEQGAGLWCASASSKSSA